MRLTMLLCFSTFASSYGLPLNRHFLYCVDVVFGTFFLMSNCLAINYIVNSDLDISTYLSMIYYVTLLWSLFVSPKTTFP